MLKMIRNLWNDRKGATDIVSILLIIAIAILFAVLFYDPITNFVHGLCL